MSIYGSVSDGDLYFANLFGRDAWKEASVADKNAALFEATQTIEMYNYRGDKTDPNQTLQFPRGGDTVVPTNIVWAAYEEAYQILRGRDNEAEVKDLRVQQRKFGQVVTQYMPGAKAPPNVAAGMLSSKAWRLLTPYFRLAEEIKLIRV